jgi:catecholate siderophore receptor
MSARRSQSSGIAAYRRSGRAAGPAGLALMSGLMALSGAGPAHAEEAASVAGVQVNGRGGLLDRSTGLSVMPATIQDTPQAISVIGDVQLKQQGATSLEQALRNVPGITIAIGEGGTLSGDQFKIRGFDAKDDVYIDGLRDFGSYTRDSFNYQEVQVLKGPSGAMFGRGTTGGAINTISKSPRLDDFASVDGYVGNGDYYRALADINHRLGDTTAARLALMYNDTGVVDRDHIFSKRWGAALTVETGIGTDTQASVSYLHQHWNGRPDYGITIVQKPGDITALPATEYDIGVSRANFLGFLDDVDRGDADILTVRLSHQVNDKVSLTSDTRYGSYRRYFQYSTLDQCAAACTAALFDGNPSTIAYGGIGGSSPYDADSWGLQNISTARIDYDVGRLKNQLIAGVDLSRQVNNRQYFAYTLPAPYATRPAMPHPIDKPDPNFPAGYTLFRPVPGQNLNCSGSGNCTTTFGGATVFTNVAGTATLKSRGEATDAGVFLSDRLWLTDQISVIGSLRFDRYTAQLDSLLYNGLTSPVGGLKVTSNLKSPRVSLVFEPSDRQTFYVSWGKSQTPQGASIVGSGGSALTISAKDLKPEDSKIVEAGAKVLIPSTRLSFTASIFDIKKDNALQADPATGFLQAQSGERQEVKGVELSLTGQITDAWTVSASYTYLDAKIKDSYSNCTVTAASATGTPTTIACPVGVATAFPVLNTVALGQQVTFVPKHAAALFTTYNFDNLLPGLTAGGDVTYQSKLPVAYTARSVSYANRSVLTAARLAQAPENITIDAFAAYETGRYRVAINVYNLADRLNYTQVWANRAVPAAGRTVIFSVGANF